MPLARQMIQQSGASFSERATWPTHAPYHAADVALTVMGLTYPRFDLGDLGTAEIPFEPPEEPRFQGDRK